MRGKHDLIKNRHYFEFGDEIKYENYLVLNLSILINEFANAGYEVIRTNQYSCKPLENQIVAFPVYNPNLCKILHNKKVIYFTDMSIILGLNTSDDLNELLELDNITRDVLEDVTEKINTIGIEATDSSKVAKDFFKNYEFTGDIPENKYIANYSAGGYLFNKLSDEMAENVYVYDINSYFPAIASSVPLPYTFGISFTNVKYNAIQGCTYFTSCEVISANIKKNKQPLQVGHAASKFYLKNANHDFLLLTNLEVDYIYKNYTNVNIKFYKVDVYATRNDLFKNYIKILFDEKNAAKVIDDAVAYRIAKLKINSFIGRIGSPFSRDKAHYALHRYLISYSKINLCNIINEINEKYGPDKFIYSDTDSIHCKLSPADFSTLHGVRISNDGLGDFKLEHHYEYCWYKAGYKSYIGLENKKVICKLAGVPYSCRKSYEEDFLNKVYIIKGRKE